MTSFHSLMHATCYPSFVFAPIQSCRCFCFLVSPTCVCVCVRACVYDAVSLQTTIALKRGHASLNHRMHFFQPFSMFLSLKHMFIVVTPWIARAMHKLWDDVLHCWFKVTVFWDDKPGRLLSADVSESLPDSFFGGIDSQPGDECGRIFRNVGTHLPNYTCSHFSSL